NKRLQEPLPPLTLSVVMAALGLVVSLPCAAMEMLRHGTVSATWAAMLGVIYYALVPTVIGFWLWYHGAARVSGTEASLYHGSRPSLSGHLVSAGARGTVHAPAGCRAVTCCDRCGIGYMGWRTEASCDRDVVSSPGRARFSRQSAVARIAFR